MVFTIVDAHRSDPPVYRLADCHGDKLDGTFYEPELQKVVVTSDRSCVSTQKNTTFSRRTPEGRRTKGQDVSS